MSDARSSRPSGRDDESRREGSSGESHHSPGDDPESLDDFAAVLYEELRTLAHRQLMGERAGHTLSTTALVHEAYLKLARLDRIEWKNRAQFCAEAARAMRRILVDYAVRRGAQKRGGDRVRVEFDDSLAITDADAGNLLALHRALEELESHHARHARVVECRFFGGMTIPEVGQALDISPATVKRDWAMARAWLNQQLAG